MNTQPHVHRAQVVRTIPFPRFAYRWYVKYGDQYQLFGVDTWFRRSPNPKNWTPEERERRIAAALTKAIAKHDAGSIKAARAQMLAGAIDDTVRRIGPFQKRLESSGTVMNYAGYLGDTLDVRDWPSEAVDV